MFAARKESGWNMVLKPMKCVTAIAYRCALGWGRNPLGKMKLLLSKGGSLIRGGLGWVKARSDGAWRLEVLGQGRDLRQVLQLEWVIVGGKRDVFIFESRFGGSDTWHFRSFCGACFQENFPKWSCLSVVAWVVLPLPSSWSNREKSVFLVQILWFLKLWLKTDFYKRVYLLFMV